MIKHIDIKATIDAKELTRKLNRYDNRPSLLNLKDKNDLVGLEIGTQYGYNAYNILSKYNIKVLYLIDPYDSEESKKNSTELKSIGIIRFFLEVFLESHLL